MCRFEGSQCPARLLEEITIVDTPGVLSGEKQRIERNYNFVEVRTKYTLKRVERCGGGLGAGCAVVGEAAHRAQLPLH